MNFLNATSASAGMGSTLIMLVMMIAIFYFMLIRPENKRKKEAEQMRSSVKKGDKIVTIGGICGVVVDVKESRIVLETGADHIAGRYSGDGVGHGMASFVKCMSTQGSPV